MMSDDVAYVDRAALLRRLRDFRKDCERMIPADCNRNVVSGPLPNNLPGASKVRTARGLLVFASMHATAGNLTKALQIEVEAQRWFYLGVIEGIRSENTQAAGQEPWTR